ncbi:MAG TPA: hypothetical protein PLF32_06840 [Bacteroidales bacterium]|jgi:AAA15 family ATPase/GTPase|nr:hypothetical protein [Bacteroidales bacterium]HOR82355.1 hypothetical protein [Bacteroidales bacterium]
MINAIMKINKLILFEAITIFYLFVGCSSINDKQIAALKYRLPIFDSLPHLYKVERIRSINKIAYAIDLTDEGKYSYTLISLKSEKLEREKIKKGKKYLLIIYAYYNYNYRDSNTKNNDIYIIGDPLFFIEIEDYKFWYYGDFKHTGHIVLSPNIKGLFYIPPDG